MKTTNQVKPINQEMDWDKSETLISKTDRFGTIEYCNEVFCAVSEYDDFELMNTAHNIIRHPDMPKVIFKWLWDNLNQDKTIVAIVKNMTKSGKYYWVYANFTILKDDEGNNRYFSKRRSISDKVVSIIEPVYKNLLEIEKSNGIDASEDYLNQFLKDNNTTYDDFISKVLNEN